MEGEEPVPRGTLRCRGLIRDGTFEALCRLGRWPLSGHRIERVLGTFFGSDPSEREGGDPVWYEIVKKHASVSSTFLCFSPLTFHSCGPSGLPSWAVPFSVVTAPFVLNALRRFEGDPNNQSGATAKPPCESPDVLFRRTAREVGDTASERLCTCSSPRKLGALEK